MKTELMFMHELNRLHELYRDTLTCAFPLEAHEPGLSLTAATKSPNGTGSEDHRWGWGREAVGSREAQGSHPDVSSNCLRCCLVTSVLWAAQPI